VSTLFAAPLLFSLVVVAQNIERSITVKYGDAVRSQQGLLVHSVNSPRQSGETEVRVLLPTKRNRNEQLSVVYVLPVEARNGKRWGDPFRVILKSKLHDRFGCAFVYPTFAKLPWYADHPTDPRLAQEAYFLQDVVPFIEKTYPVLRKAQGRLLLGFSKSGWGAFSLILRHPDKFSRAASWDAPLMMDGPGKYGTGPIFGTQANFAHYEVTRLLEKKRELFSKQTRLILLGYGGFRKEHLAAHALMQKLSIRHVDRDGPQRKHHWETGWVNEAVELLFAKEHADR
jgi:hypothetical protein